MLIVLHQMRCPRSGQPSYYDNGRLTHILHRRGAFDGSDSLVQFLALPGIKLLGSEDLSRHEEAPSPDLQTLGSDDGADGEGVQCRPNMVGRHLYEVP